MKIAAGLNYREAGSGSAGVALLIHGYPESSYMWRAALPALAGAGWHAIAPDLAGYGDSPVDRPGTWERHTEAIARFVEELGVGPLALITHDWGVMIGLRWACEQPDLVSALVISDGGFFSDRRWHDVANVMRTPDAGERLVRGYTRDGLADVLRALSSGVTEEATEEYWKAFADDERRLAQLDLYRSGDFEKLQPYEGALGRLAAPALVVWGAEDRFAGVKMARRFHAELADSELLIVDDAGHFVWEDAHERVVPALLDFLFRRVGKAG